MSPDAPPGPPAPDDASSPQAGSWVENMEQGQLECEADNSDFSYGCIDNGEFIEFVCGDGPGTDCSGVECDACGDDGDQILFCFDGKLGSDSCQRICEEDGDARGITYDFGECVVGETGPECACCDEGDEGCPV